MSKNILWRSGVFVVTIIAIYLAFPILIIPSSLPAIQQMFVENEIPQEYSSSNIAIETSNLPTDTEIYQLTIPTIPTLKEKITVLKKIHKQGINKIFNLN